MNGRYNWAMGSILRQCAILMMCVLTLSGATGPSAAAADDNYEAAIRELRAAVNGQRDGSHLRRLLALRNLRDPALRPLLYQLVQHPQWQVQVHAVLGLAEINETGKVDWWHITQMQPEGQASVIATALDFDQLDEDGIQGLLEWDGLLPMPRLLLLAEQVSKKKPVDDTALARLAENPDLRAAGLASALMAQRGEPSGMSAFAQRLARQATAERKRLTQWMFEAVRQYKLDALSDWLDEQLAAEDVDRTTAYWGVYALLELDHARGLKAWRQHLSRSPSQVQRVRYGLLLLASTAVEAAAVFDELKPDPENPLLWRITAVGRALADDQDVARALLDLLELGHARSTEWAMDFVENQPPAVASPVYKQLLAQIATMEADLARVDAIAISNGIASVTQLHAIDPKFVMERLESAADDSLTQQILLLGLLDAHSTDAAEVAKKLRRIGSGRADSLTLLLIASPHSELSSDDVEQLGLTASGSRLATELRTQAAWLYVRHSNRVDQAISRLFPD